MVTVGIVGGGGYTSGELLRILFHHPRVLIAFVQSKSQAGKKLYEVHRDLYGDTEMVFSQEIMSVDVMFLCMGHGASSIFMENHNISPKTLIIDLSHDHRLNIHRNKWVYGMPELNRSQIQTSRRIANCGCFATAVQLGLYPLVASSHTDLDISITAITGSTGAGQSTTNTTHFSYRDNNLSVYKPFSHQHEAEIKESFCQLNPNVQANFQFLPIRGPFPRGIFCITQLRCKQPLEEILTIYQDFYSSEDFVHITTEEIHLKQVINTNKCLIQLTKVDDKLGIITVIDNLIKGASGMAVQNMNIALGFEETKGLNLKAIAY